MNQCILRSSAIYVCCLYFLQVHYIYTKANVLVAFCSQRRLLRFGHVVKRKTMRF